MFWLSLRLHASAARSALSPVSFVAWLAKALKVIATQIDELIRELRRSMNYLQTQNQGSEASGNSKIDAMYLCGGGAKLRGLDQYIQSKLGIPVTTIGVFDNPIITQNGAITGSGIDLAVATGLAMRPMVNAA